MKNFDTIAAVSTPQGVGGIAVIRVSGDRAFEITDKVFCTKSGKKLTETETHKIVYGFIKDEDGCNIDEVLVSKMDAPHTFTGENVTEISCHGGVSVVKLVLKELLKAGARLAANGEFTKRAFLNGKIDLAQAEAVIDIINADSELNVYNGENQLYGALTDKLMAIRNSLIDITSDIIAVIDYPEEDITVENISETIEKLKKANDDIQLLMKSYHTGKILKEGAKIVIAGKPNVGKSSLLNALLKENRAIVTEIEGTTRDVLEESLEIDGLKVRIMDTAGVRTSADEVEKIGIDKAIENIESADLVLFVLDKSRELSDEDIELMERIKDKNAFVVLNKSDLEIKLSLTDIRKHLPGKRIFEISSKTFDGINEMTEAIKDKILDGDVNIKENVYISNERHFEMLHHASEHIKQAVIDLENGIYPDIVSIEIENAISSLGEITGQTVSDEIIHNIFAKFCLGK
ncbi:MAG: tRNA uridine-5-carboxymethylaminomethyl(34) synthesis GTPase MnmE [Clostridia bacterium]|nr:tRNA uridine-5-carboxymethylaminomethyl(34) synthesis GTPase MnmE [Clostridia bacterium]